MSLYVVEALFTGLYAGYGLTRPIKLSSNSRNNQSQRPETDEKQRETHVNIHHHSNKSKIIHNRILKTFSYLTSSIGITAISALTFFKYGYALKNISHMRKHPTLYLISSMISSFVLFYKTRKTNYHRNKKLKHLFWILLNINQGCMLSVLGFIGGRLLFKCLVLSAHMLIGISLLSCASYSYMSKHRFLNAFGKYLGLMVGFLCGLSLVEYYSGKSVGGFLSNIKILLSLLVFGIKMAYDVHHVIRNAEESVNVEVFNMNMDGNGMVISAYDPINEQIDVYLNSLNFFLEILEMLIAMEIKKKREHRNENNDDEDEERIN